MPSEDHPSLFEVPKPPAPTVKVRIEENWKKALEDEFNAEYFKQIKAFLIQEKESGYNVFPPGGLIFNAFDSTPFNQVKVVIIGQDPYHGKGQAHGLCFSVPEGIQIPPSLVNIYKEINNDLDIPLPNQGNLAGWASQGVLLLNAILTVRANQAASHHDSGWETFTNAAIAKLSSEGTGIVFMLWGKYAQEKEALIDPTRHLILKSTHPSPYSASSGFFGCKHFSKANRYLEKLSKKPIDWSV